IAKLAKKLLLPSLVFQLIYTGYYFFIGKDDLLTGIFEPHWCFWIFFCLFSWHLLLFWFKKLPPLVGLAITVQIGLIVGYFGDIGHTFSLSRTFVFFPFFLAGYWLTEKHVMWLKEKRIKAASIVVMLVVAVAIYVATEFNSGWL